MDSNTRCFRVFGCGKLGMSRWKGLVLVLRAGYSIQFDGGVCWIDVCELLKMGVSVGGKWWRLWLS